MGIKKKIILPSFSVNNKSTLIANFGIGWIIFFSIVYQKIAPIGFGLLIISLFFGRKRDPNRWSNFLSWKNPSIWFIIYYLLLIFGLFWTENVPFGLTKLENKLTFLLFPFIVLFLNHHLQVKQLISIFHWSLIIALSISYFLAINDFLNDQFNNLIIHFSGSKFTPFMHRSYFACYLLIGVIFLLDQIRHSFEFSKLFFIFLFSVAIIQTGSKAGALALFLVFTIYGLLFMLNRNRLFGWILFAGLSLIFTLIFITNNPLKTRFDTTWSALENIKTENNPSTESNTARIIMWKTSLDVWIENFIFGTGTGDYNDDLNLKNKQKGNLGVAEEELNSHNQFLNTSVQLGIIGLLVLCMIFISSFIASGNSIWKIMILITFIVNFLVESFLETQSGIVLFCVILILFLTNQTKFKTSSI